MLTVVGISYPTPHPQPTPVICTYQARSLGTYRKRKISGNLTDTRRCWRQVPMTLTSHPDVHPMMRVPGLTFSTRRRCHVRVLGHRWVGYGCRLYAWGSCGWRKLAVSLCKFPVTSYCSWFVVCSVGLKDESKVWGDF